jgi:hypothetical protein
MNEASLAGGIVRVFLGFALLLAAGVGGIRPVPAQGELGQSDLPSFHAYETYRVDPYIKAAAKIQAMGKEKAGQRLLEMAKESHTAIILARMLFSAKPDKQFRRPALGAPYFLAGTYEDWPLEPIEVVDGVPFLVVRGYLLGGRPEPAQKYVDYCLRECDWAATQFSSKTADQKQAALTKLLALPKLKNTLGLAEKRFLSSQIK